MAGGMRVPRARTVITLALLLSAAIMLYVARKALLPFILGTMLAYIMLPMISLLNRALPPQLRRRSLCRGLSVLAVYVLALAVLIGSLAFVIPPIADQVGFLAQRLPEFARNVYSVAPRTVQEWLDRYNRLVPQDIQAALQRGLQDTIQSLIGALQKGIFRTVGVVFSTLSFVLGLLVVPLWMFYILRDQPEIIASFYSLVPSAYRVDARNILNLMDYVLGAYLRGRLILGLAMAIMCTAGLLTIGVDFALLLGTVAGLFEIVPLLGPILAAIPILVVTVATSAPQLPWVILLFFGAQQVVDYVLVPLVAHETVRLHPALVMLVIVVGSEVAGIWGVLLGLPIAAIVRDVARYLYLRLSDTSSPPKEALALVRGRD